MVRMERKKRFKIFCLMAFLFLNVSELLAKDKMTIMLVGQTGAGKSTMINSLVNQILNPTLSDKMLISVGSYDHNVERTEVNYGTSHNDYFESESQDSSYQSGTMRWRKHYIETDKYLLTIIDTPGLGDPDRGHQPAMESIEECLKNETVHAIAYVVSASDTKLVKSYKEMMDRLSTLFHRDFYKNQIFLISKADTMHTSTIGARSRLGLTFEGNSNEGNTFIYGNHSFYILSEQPDVDDPGIRKVWARNLNETARLLEYCSTLSPVSAENVLELQSLKKKARDSVVNIADQFRKTVEHNVALYKLQSKLSSLQKIREENRDFIDHVERTAFYLDFQCQLMNAQGEVYEQRDTYRSIRNDLESQSSANELALQDQNEYMEKIRKHREEVRASLSPVETNCPRCQTNYSRHYANINATEEEGVEVSLQTNQLRQSLFNEAEAEIESILNLIDETQAAKQVCESLAIETAEKLQDLESQIKAITYNRKGVVSFRFSEIIQNLLKNGEFPDIQGGGTFQVDPSLIIELNQKLKEVKKVFD